MVEGLVTGANSLQKGHRRPTREKTAFALQGNQVGEDISGIRRWSHSDFPWII